MGHDGCYNKRSRGGEPADEVGRQYIARKGFRVPAQREGTDATGFLHTPKSSLRLNEFGAAAGGTVVIPRIYNGRNRTFYYAAFEGYKFRGEPPNKSTITVLT